MKLEPGMLIKTNYSGPYRIVSIDRNCTCTGYGYEEYKQPHIHLTVCDPNNKSDLSYLNGWLENELRSVTKSYCGHKTKLDYDTITVLENDRPVQQTLF